MTDAKRTGADYIQSIRVEAVNLFIEAMAKPSALAIVRTPAPEPKKTLRERVKHAIHRARMAAASWVAGFDVTEKD